MNPDTVEPKDIYERMVRTTAALAGRKIVRLSGCPVSVAEQIQAFYALESTGTVDAARVGISGRQDSRV